MAHNSEGICMICKNKPTPEETITCTTCTSPWHVTCLSSPLETLASALEWTCPDCSMINPPQPSIAGTSGGSDDLVAAVKAIEDDVSLSDLEKAKRRQQLLSGAKVENDHANHEKNELTCPICTQSLDRPVTTSCGHNFCLKCFEKWVNQQKQEKTTKRFKLTCASCRREIPESMASQPRINPALVVAIRMEKMSKSSSTGTSSAGGSSQKVYYNSIHNQHRPDKAFTTERAKKAGKANACSGKIFVTVPLDHFGPIPAEHDPTRNQGVLVGESWEDRMECRQWGAHFPHVAGICGQKDHGAQSVALSGGYVDDEDHGEWFLYTGSGGRDLSGNKRTNKLQTSDQKFEKLNEALRLSCLKGYPVRVVRSHKEKRSSYAPENGVRYDGTYRIEKCWRKNGIQGHKVCRYLFVRCDNDPAPWTSDDHGDRPRPLPEIKELENAVDITERRGSPSWDYDEDKGRWIWKKPAPPSKKPVDSGNPEEGKQQRTVKRQAKIMPVREKFPKEFSCQICWKVMVNPLTTPCAHNFCKACLEGAFAGQSFLRQRTREGGRTLRVQKNVMRCPSCSNDIADFLQNPQVNRELMGVIESLQRKTAEEISEQSSQETNDTHEKSDAVAGDTEICNADDKILEEPEDNITKPQTEAKPQQTCALPKQPDAGSAENGVGPVIIEMADSREPQATEIECQSNQTLERKEADNVGSLEMEDSEVMTGNKRAKTE